MVSHNPRRKSSITLGSAFSSLIRRINGQHRADDPAVKSDNPALNDLVDNFRQTGKLPEGGSSGPGLTKYPASTVRAKLSEKIEQLQGHDQLSLGPLKDYNNAENSVEQRLNGGVIRKQVTETEQKKEYLNSTVYEDKIPLLQHFTISNPDSNREHVMMLTENVDGSVDWLNVNDNGTLTAQLHHFDPANPDKNTTSTWAEDGSDPMAKNWMAEANKQIEESLGRSGQA